MTDDIIDLKEVLERVQQDKELLLELLGIFLEDCPIKIAAIKEALPKKDFKQLHELAHSMKGASGNLSAKSISAHFLQIEQTAKNNDVSGIAECVVHIEKELQELRTYLEKLKKGF